MTADEKQCSKCHGVFPIESFNFRNKRKGERQAFCKKCDVARAVKYARENRPQVYERARQWREGNRERVNARARALYRGRRELVEEARRVEAIQAAVELLRENGYTVTPPPSR